MFFCAILILWLLLPLLFCRDSLCEVRVFGVPNYLTEKKANACLKKTKKTREYAYPYQINQVSHFKNKQDGSQIKSPVLAIARCKHGESAAVVADIVDTHRHSGVNS